LRTYAHSQSVCSLRDSKLSTLGVRHPSSTPDPLLFAETFAQPCIFAVVDCVDVALSVFYYPVLTRCRIFLQLSTAMSLDTGDILCSLQ